MSSNFTPEQRERLEIIGFSSEIEVEDEKRRICTNFGYNRGGLPIMVLWMGLSLFISAFLVMIVAMSYDGPISQTPLIWLAIAPTYVGAPLVPFLFLKLRYAVKALAIAIAIVVTVITAGALMNAAALTLPH